MRMSIDTFNINIDDVKFTESGVIANHEKKSKKIKLLSHIHILGYKKNKQDALSVVCLEYGIFAEGKNKKQAIQNLTSLVKFFLVENSVATVNHALECDTEIMRCFWALYRIYEKKQINKISINIAEIKKHTEQKTTKEALEKELRDCKIELERTSKILELLMQENTILLKDKLKSNDNNYHIINQNTFFLEDDKYSPPIKNNTYA